MTGNWEASVGVHAFGADWLRAQTTLDVCSKVKRSFMLIDEWHGGE